MDAPKTALHDVVFALSTHTGFVWKKTDVQCCLMSMYELCDPLGIWPLIEDVVCFVGESVWQSVLSNWI